VTRKLPNVCLSASFSRFCDSSSKVCFLFSFKSDERLIRTSGDGGAETLAGQTFEKDNGLG
jgi:hypothetical protein